MPKIPRWMANAMEALFSGSYHKVRLMHIKPLAPQLIQLRFEGDFNASKIAFTPGNVIEFRVSDTEFRHYTPSSFNKEAGICETIVYLHDKGPGSKWLGQLREGDTLKLLGPGGRMKMNTAAFAHFAFGDETSLGLMKCIASAAEKAHQSCTCIAELDAAHMDWPQHLDLSIKAVPKNAAAQQDAVFAEIQLFLQQIYKNEAAFYLSGNASSIQAVRKYLLSQNIKAAQIQSDPYWAAGKTGL